MVEDAGLEPAYDLAYPLSQSPKSMFRYSSRSLLKNQRTSRRADLLKNVNLSLSVEGRRLDVLPQG